MLKMVIANSLSDGLVVFLTANGTWVESIATGSIAVDDAESERLLDLGLQSEASCQVVEPYLIEITETDGVRVPIIFREAIRAAGPTA